MTDPVTRPISCTSCGGDVEDAICAGCKSLQPPGQIDHFARLGLPRGFAVDGAMLERHYFAAQRRFHPDRFAGRGAREKNFSLQHATLINEAYETLRDPLSRARYLLETAGRPLPGDDGRSIADPELLMEAMEWREALEEAETPEQVAGIAARLATETRAVEARIGDAFAGHNIDGATRETLRLSYLVKLGTELKRRGAPQLARI